MIASPSGQVVAVARDGAHRFSKELAEEITLVAGLGVQGDAHAGALVQHRSRVAADPTQPNLRQVHLIQVELLEELNVEGFDLQAGQLGENITTRGVDLLALPQGSLLALGDEAVVEVTGLRNPCWQIGSFRAGLLKRVVERDESGRVRRKAGVMGVVAHGGPVQPGDGIRVALPSGPHIELGRV